MSERLALTGSADVSCYAHAELFISTAAAAFEVVDVDMLARCDLAAWRRRSLRHT